MRLWHESLLPYLPRMQLLGQHREACALRGKGWGRKHSVVNYVFTHPRRWLYAYHIKVMDEMKRRGYHPDEKWYQMTPEETSETEIPINSNTSIYPEHNSQYLEECLQNLESKGISLREDIANHNIIPSKPSK